MMEGSDYGSDLHRQHNKSCDRRVAGTISDRGCHDIVPYPTYPTLPYPTLPYPTLAWL